MLYRKLHLLLMCTSMLTQALTLVLIKPVFSLQKHAVMLAEVRGCNIIVETIAEEVGNVLPLPPVFF